MSAWAFWRRERVCDVIQDPAYVPGVDGQDQIARRYHHDCRDMYLYHQADDMNLT